MTFSPEPEPLLKIPLKKTLKSLEPKPAPKTCNNFLKYGAFPSLLEHFLTSAGLMTLIYEVILLLLEA